MAVFSGLRLLAFALIQSNASLSAVFVSSFVSSSSVDRVVG